ncbi:MAG: DUF2905 domain-containing protein [Bacteroidota bacterium]
MNQLPKILIGLGILLLLSGIMLMFFKDKLTWLGKLPGDIRIERDNFKFYFPITTMLLISVAISLLVHLIRRFF